MFRLYPLYWCMIAAILLLGRLAHWQHFPQAFLEQPLPAALANLTMLQVFFGFPHLLGQAWTLMFELLFYLILSLLFAVKLTRRTMLVAVYFILGALLVEGALPQITGNKLPNGILSFFGTMFVGSALYRYTRNEASFAAAAGVVGLGIVMEVGALIGDAGLEPIWRQWITARLAAYAVFLIALAGRELIARYGQRWQHLGVISYSVYLIHPLIISYAPRTGAAWMTVALWAAILLPTAHVTYHLIEAPYLRLGRRLAMRFAR